jgi:hypothetical protein
MRLLEEIHRTLSHGGYRGTDVGRLSQ